MSQTTLVLLILAATVALFASDRLRVDVVALLSLLGLAAAGAVTTDQALAGLSAPIVVMIGGLFIVGRGLANTGIAARVATAVAALLAPVALEMAGRLGLGPELLLLGVAVAASTAFATPVASPVNALVLGPGGYRFGDFLKAGLTLQIAVLVVCGGLIALCAG